MATEPTDPARRAGPPNRVVRAAVVGILVASTVGGWVGDLFLSVLVPDHPLVLLSLSDRIRNLVLLSPHLDAVSYYGVGFVRFVVPDVMLFLLGRWYGQAAVRWMEHRTPSLGRLVRWVEQLFGRVRYGLVFLAQMNLVCVLAGASSMSLGTFLVLNTLGTVLMLVSFRWAAGLLGPELERLDVWIRANRPAIFVVTAVVLGGALWWQHRRGGGTEVDQLAHLDEELAASAAELAAEGGGSEVR